MLSLIRAQLHQLPSRGNFFTSRLSQISIKQLKVSNKFNDGSFRRTVFAQHFSSWKGRSIDLQSKFKRSYNTGGGDFGNITPDQLIYGILGINIFVFGCIQFAKLEKDPLKLRKIDYFIMRNLGYSSLNLKEGRLWTMFTSGFTHETFMHLLYNSMTLYFFGPTIAAVLGTKRFLWFYMWSGVSANVASSIYNKLFLNQRINAAGTTLGDVTTTIGASGHTMGILAYFGLRFPFETIYLYFIPVPACLLVSGLILYDLSHLKRPSSSHGSTVNHNAHVGGALFGAIFFFLTRRPSSLLSNPRWRGRP